MSDREPTTVERLKRVENKLLADGNQYGAEVCFRAAKKLEAAEAKLKAVGELQRWQAESFNNKTSLVQLTTDSKGEVVRYCDIQKILTG